MNQRSLQISAALLAVVVVVFGYFVFFGGDGGSRPEIPTGPGQASEARNIIADMQERQAETAPQQAAAAREPQLIGRATETQASGGTSNSNNSGAVAVITTQPAPAAPTGAGAQLDEAFEQAREMQVGGQLDDAMVLYFFGARQGHAQSAFRYAEMNDPLHLTAAISPLPEPAPSTAFRFYKVALDAGFEDAAERLDALHQWAVDAAAAGDFDAEMLLEQWEQ